jgi:DNA mismatch repair protein MutL
MGKIKILDANVYEKIAAGEVIERPLSVVKELVENSIDAGADDISVFLTDGGKRAIRVEDNGQGFDPDDIETAFKRHSTSKLTELSDLDRISTLGFRGEALPSVLEVSRVSLESANNDDGAGVMAEFRDRQMVAVRAIACNRGTRIEVEDLFYNFPVRKKFLKSDRTELNQITAFVQQCCLANFHISFSLDHNGKTVFRYKKTASLRERIYQVFGKEFLDGLQEISYGQPPVSITGFASRTNAGAAHKRHQYFFVNHRPVREKTLFAALNQSYGNYLEKSRSPVAILLIEVPPGEIDVNVHPMKLEVKFKDSGQIFKFMKIAIDLSLGGGKPFAAMRDDRGQPGGFSRTEPGTAADGRPETGISESGWISQPGLFDRHPGPEASYSIIGQFQDSYILVEKDGELLVIDQHNAHERIHFDRIKGQYRERKVVSITPLFPLVIELTPSEKIALDNDRLDLLERMGFELRALSGNAYDVKKFPRILEERLVRDVVLAILHLEEGEDIQLEDRVFSEIACKSSIKVNHRLYPEEMRQIVGDLFRTSNPNFCPHRRPIITRITREEIEKKLKRK